jgi:hypothetical protein
MAKISISATNHGQIIFNTIDEKDNTTLLEEKYANIIETIDIARIPTQRYPSDQQINDRVKLSDEKTDYQTDFEFDFFPFKLKAFRTSWWDGMYGRLSKTKLAIARIDDNISNYADADKYPIVINIPHEKLAETLISIKNAIQVSLDKIVETTSITKIAEIKCN